MTKTDGTPLSDLLVRKLREYNNDPFQQGRIGYCGGMMYEWNPYRAQQLPLPVEETGEMRYINYHNSEKEELWANGWMEEFKSRLAPIPSNGLYNEV